jgi:hypothetical protein
MLPDYLKQTQIWNYQEKLHLECTVNKKTVKKFLVLSTSVIFLGRVQSILRLFSR